MTELTPKQARMLEDLNAESRQRPVHVHTMRTCFGGALRECTSCYLLEDNPDVDQSHS